MLSTKYRLRLESICKDIASGTEVTLEDMICCCFCHTIIDIACCNSLACSSSSSAISAILLSSG